MSQGQPAKRDPKRIQTYLRFKGARNYLQGPDLFAAAQSSLQSCFGSDWAVMEIRFHRMTVSQCDLVAGEQTGRVADLMVTGDPGGLQPWCLVPRDEPVTERCDYDEDRIISASFVHGDSIAMGTRSSANAIEEIVSLTKRLHLANFTGVPGKWLFVGLRLVRPLVVEADGPFRITLRRSLGGRLTQSVIESNGVHLGEIDFALLTAPTPQ